MARPKSVHTTIEEKVEGPVGEQIPTPNLDLGPDGIDIEPVKEVVGFEEDYFKKLKASGIDVSYKGTWQKMYVHFLNKIFGTNGKPVLDLGCGMGAITSAFGDYKCPSVGVDISKFACDNSPFKNIKLINKPAWDLSDIPDSSIDFIHAMYLFNLIPEDKVELMFSEIKRVAKNEALVFSILDLGCQKISGGNAGTIYPKYFWDEYAAKNGMKDGAKAFYPKMLKARVPGWDFMRVYNWPYLLYKVVK